MVKSQGTEAVSPIQLAARVTRRERELPFSQQDHDNNNNTKRSDLPGWACCFRRRPRPRRVGSWNTLTFTAARGRPRSHARSEISGETPAGLGVTGWNQCCRSWRFRDKNLRFARVTAETPLTIGSQFLSLQRETILRLVFKERVQERESARVVIRNLSKDPQSALNAAYLWTPRRERDDRGSLCDYTSVREVDLGRPSWLSPGLLFLFLRSYLFTIKLF